MNYTLLTILLIVFVIVFVISFGFFIVPKIKPFFAKFKKTKKEDKEKETYIVDKNDKVEDNATEQPPEKDIEVASIKEFLKLPPEKELTIDQSGSSIERQPLQTRPRMRGFEPGDIAKNVGQDSGFLPSVADNDTLWDDDLAKRLYLDERPPQPVSPYEVYRRENKQKTNDQFRNLSPEMKKVLLSDLLKKKN